MTKQQAATKRIRTEDGTPDVTSSAKQRCIARIDDASRELLESSFKEGYVPLARLEHTGLARKKGQKCRLGNSMKVTIRTYGIYHGTCIGSGKWKEVFLLQGEEGRECTQGIEFDNYVLKTTKLHWAGCPRALDVEPRVFRKTAHTEKTLKVFLEFIAIDQDNELHHCWITERLTPLAQLLAAPLLQLQAVLDVERLAVSLTEIVATLAHEEHIFIKDCKADNFGMRLDGTPGSSSRANQEIVLIDGGHRDIAPEEPHHRKNFNQALSKLWEVTNAFAPITTKAMRSMLKHDVAADDFLNFVKNTWQYNPSVVRDGQTREGIYEACFGTLGASASGAQGRRSSEITLSTAVLTPNPDWRAAEHEAALLIHTANLELLTPERVKNGKLPEREDVMAALKRMFAENAGEQRIIAAILATWELGYEKGKQSQPRDID